MNRQCISHAATVSTSAICMPSPEMTYGKVAVHEHFRQASIINIAQHRQNSQIEIKVTGLHCSCNVMFYFHSRDSV